MKFKGWKLPNKKKFQKYIVTRLKSKEHGYKMYGSCLRNESFKIILIIEAVILLASYFMLTIFCNPCNIPKAS